MQWSITLCQTAFPDSFAKIAIFRHIHRPSLAEPLCRFPITPITPITLITPVVPVVPIAPIAPVILIKNISCAILWNDSVLGVRGPVLAKKTAKKVRKNLAVDEKGRTFALAFRE